MGVPGEGRMETVANRERKKKGKCLGSWPLVLADHQTQTKQDDQDEQLEWSRQEALQLYASHQGQRLDQAQEADYLARVWRLGLSCVCRGGRQLCATTTASALEHSALATAAGRGLGQACGGAPSGL